MAQIDVVTTTSRVPAPTPGAARSPLRDTIRDAHARLIAAVLNERPHVIDLALAGPADLEERSRHLRAVLQAAGAYVEAAFADAADNAPIGGPGRVSTAARVSAASLAADLPNETAHAFASGDRRYAQNLLHDLGAETAGALELAADDWRCS